MKSTREHVAPRRLRWLPQSFGLPRSGQQRSHLGLCRLLDPLEPRVGQDSACSTKERACPRCQRCQRCQDTRACSTAAVPTPIQGCSTAVPTRIQGYPNKQMTHRIQTPTNVSLESLRVVEHSQSLWPCGQPAAPSACSCRCGRSGAELIVMFYSCPPPPFCFFRYCLRASSCADRDSRSYCCCLTLFDSSQEQPGLGRTI